MLNIPDNNEEADYKPHPWLRLFAKTIDLFIFSFCVGFVAETNNYQLNYSAASYVCLFIWPLIEAAFISSIGTTPGKWLMEISVVNEADGNDLSYIAALERGYLVLLQGMWLGLPILWIIACIISYSKLKRNHVTPWDTYVGAKIIYREINPLKEFAAAAFLILVIYFSIS